MKKIIPYLFLISLAYTAHAQNGLENVLVEKYYISEANDTNANPDGGVLPVGSITYRIYADMLPGYRFQAGYGIPGHELRFETTTLFFNNEDRGATTPTYTKSHAEDNTVMLDSWLSVGAACTGNFGVMKDLDDGVATIVNSYSPQVLQGADATAGIPIMTQDGIIAGTPEPVTLVGISTEIAVFDNQNDGTNGPVFSTLNGSWASLNGSIGPDSIDNKVLIAQITTNGTFSFKLNIQIGTPTGGVENYVAQDPVGSEIQMASLTYLSTVDVVDNSADGNPYLLVYPNPASNMYTMEITSSKQSMNNSYSIFDITGNLILSKKLGVVSGKYLERIDISSLASGQYIVELSRDGVRSSQQIIKN